MSLVELPACRDRALALITLGPAYLHATSGDTAQLHAEGARRHPKALAQAITGVRQAIPCGRVAMAGSIADPLAMSRSTLYSLLARAMDRQRWRVQHGLSATP